MRLFDNTNFKDTEVKHLKFDDEFKIDIDNNKIKVILGSNGIGKSSIYKDIQFRNANYSYIDYNEVQDTMRKSKETLVIASNIATIDDKTKEEQSILDTANIKNTLKDSFGLTSKAKCDSISAKLNEYRNDSIKAFEKFSGEKLDVLFDLDDDLKEFVVKYAKPLINQTIEEAKIKEIKDSYKKKYLEIIDNYLDDDETVCPVCGNECDEPVKGIIKRKIQEINESTNVMVKDYIFNNPDVKPSDVLDKVNKLKDTITRNEIAIENIEDYIICGGEKNKANFILEHKKKLDNLKTEIAALENDKLKFYSNIKNIETRIRETFERQLHIPSNNILFDDEKKELVIKLERDISKYSTGEINFITFMVTLLEFMNSDKDTLIIDDPLSSYDIPNQYKIMYEITNVNATKKYNILILTHNIDCINIAHSQHSGLYEFELIDKINGILYINVINNLESKGFHISYIIKRLIESGSFSYTEYIDILSKKDTWPIRDPRHKLFHYDGPYTYPGSTCNNDLLVKIIDNIKIDDLKNVDSIINSANKVLYFAALRVWIEKQFYENTDDRAGLINNDFLADKISYMLDGNHWIGKNKIEKDFLMSKKVMLNQNDHTESQKEPFYYALSISTDDILNDILEIKNHFNN